jgi:hypothetical protein
VRWRRKRGRTVRTYYVRVTSGGHLARYSPTSTLWVNFTGRRVRSYDFSAVIGPEKSYGVAAGQLATVYRQPVTFGRVSVAGLRAGRPWHTAS